MTIEINGMAHVILTVNRFDVARDFYRKLLLQFGMKPVFDGDKFFYCVGGRTAIGIEPCDSALGSERFNQQRVGLHHLCLRAHSREDVDRCATVLKGDGRNDYTRTGRRQLGTGLLLRAIRRPGRHPAGGVLCPRCRSAGGRNVVRSFSSGYSEERPRCVRHRIREHGRVGAAGSACTSGPLGQK
jgi:catechol 2,3-dioxygenase-like lactoylglutathione lyase family enzyme